MRIRAALTLLLFASAASAQMSEGEKKAAARAAFLEGVELQEKGKPADALVRFEAAEKLFDAPTHLLHIGECQTVTGKLVEAAETFETLAHKALPPGSPDAFVQAQTQGATEAALLKQRIPTLRISVNPEAKSLSNLQVTVNDRQMPIELLGIARPVNPGSYRLAASAAGWATASATTLDVAEKETKEITLTLQQGATAPPGAIPPPPPPPPYGERHDGEAKPPEGPSSTGLLVGVRPTVLFPTGSVTQKLKFSDYASAGPGVGIDVIARFAKIVLAGGTLEIASLGAPSDSAFPAGTTVDVSTHSIYAGALIGVMPNVDRVSLLADAGLGFRFLSRDLTVKAGALPSQDLNEKYSGLELALNVGLSIPASWLRIVPSVGLSYGQFGNRSCDTGALASTLTGCNNTNVDSSGHTMLNLSLGLYYHADFSKKSGR